MNNTVKIIIAVSSLALVLILCLGIFACSKNGGADDQGGENAGGNNDSNHTDIEIDVGDGTENDDGSIDVEINIGDITGSGDKNDENDPDDDKITYDEYWSWTAEEREAYSKTFASMDEFFAWYNEILEEHNNKGDSPVIDENGEINLGGK